MHYFKTDFNKIKNANIFLPIALYYFLILEVLFPLSEIKYSFTTFFNSIFLKLNTLILCASNNSDISPPWSFLPLFSKSTVPWDLFSFPKISFWPDYSACEKSPNKQIVMAQALPFFVQRLPYNMLSYWWLSSFLSPWLAVILWCFFFFVFAKNAKNAC